MATVSTGVQLLDTSHGIKRPGNEPSRSNENRIGRRREPAFIVPVERQLFSG
jgi:hypothetical protein